MLSNNSSEHINRFGRLKLGHKIGIGFTLMIFGAAIISFAAWVSLDRFKGNVLVADEANTVASLSQKADRLLRTFIVTHDEETALKNATGLSSAFERIFGRMEKRLTDKEEIDLLEEMKGTSLTFWRDFSEYIAVDSENRAIRKRWEESGNRISEQINKLSEDTVESALSQAKQNQDYIAMQEWGEIDSELKKGVVKPFLEIRIASEFYKTDPNEKSWEALSGLMTALHDGLGKWSELVEHQGKEELKGPSLNIQQGIKQFSELAIGFKKNLEALDKTEKNLISSADILLRLANGMAKKKKEAMLLLISKTVTLIFALAMAGIAVGIFLAYLITRSITMPVKRIIQRMTKGSEDVGTASRQLSEVSHAFAERASEQAASLEQTSSSLEEMSSMTRQNADHANEADNLMKEANRIAGMANESMEQLTTSMGEISNASKETAKIVKDIDEIAFQTNLLALNAAVEAARAGDAGAGFAVVADEVRNLALRAAEAAKQTEQLIEGTVKKVKEGSDLVEKTGGVFSRVAESVKKVGDLVGEIATASDDQASGIDQVNKAVAEMDRVTQENAANAEESTLTSEHLRIQAAQMKAIVEELVDLVGNIRRRASKDQATDGYQPAKQDAAASASASAKDTAPKDAFPKDRKKAVSPDEVIPLDDSDFEDF